VTAETAPAARTGRVVALAAYPIKGLSAESRTSIRFTTGQGVPHDREWALARPAGAYRKGARGPLPKDQFFMLARDARLAGLTTHVEPEGETLVVQVRGHDVLRTSLGTPDGRRTAQRFFARVLDLPDGSEPLVAHEPGRRFTDVSVVSDALMHAVSFINLQSIRALEEQVGVPIDPARFRANVVFDGMPAFSELRLVGAEVRVGAARFRAVLNTRRCAATEVNPVDARRDLPIPRLLVQHFGANEMGVYGEVIGEGEVEVGDIVSYPLPWKASGDD